MMLSVIIPVYNEEHAVAGTIHAVRTALNQLNMVYEIIAVNDGSTDKSRFILERAIGIRLINNPYNLGYGASLKKGILAAKYDYILIIDADGTYPADKIPSLISYLSQYDMVVGARKKSGDPLLRRPAKAILKLLATILTGRNIPDLNSGLRIFRKDIALRFMHLFPNGFSLTTTLTLAMLTSGYTVKFVPIPYYKRKGISSIKPVRDFAAFFTLIFRVIMYFEPLKFFLFPGLFLMLLGTGYGIYQFIALDNLAQFPVLLFLSGLQICFLGLIADLIVKRR